MAKKKCKTCKTVKPDYFEKDVMAIANMLLSGIGRKGKRLLCKKLAITWSMYKGIENKLIKKIRNKKEKYSFI